MKLKEPVNRNYAAIVTKITAINPLKGRDNIVGAPLFGMQAIVGKDTKVGDIGIVFPAETQLSEEFARMNNLHNHGDLNHDQGISGYLGDNRRIRAIKLGGHRSDCLFMTFDSLKYTKAKVAELKEGDIFDEINGHPICKKYEKPHRSGNVLEKNKNPGFVRTDKKFMPEHYDSDHYLRIAEKIPDNQPLILTQKLHGTSVRVGHTIVMRKLKLREKLAKVLGVHVMDTEFDYISGSRRVIKDPNNPNQNHFYSTDIWTAEGKKLEGLLPQNFIIYGELVGWDGDAPIQKHYTYQVPQGACDLYIYRIGFVNGQGRMTDLSWEQVKEFCRDTGLKHVPELWTGLKKDLNPDDWVDKRFKDEGYANALPLEDDKSLVDEGVCVRIDGLAPYIVKLKSPIFGLHESKMKDEDAIDLEEEGSVVEQP